MKKQITLILSLFFISACSSEKLDKNVDSPEEAQDSSNDFHLVRKWQRVIRYNCAGKVTSDKQETIQSPTMRVSIQPDVYNNLYSSSFKNVTNGSDHPLISNFDTFTIDMAPTVLNMQVNEGLNEIGYKFYYCFEYKKDWMGKVTGECAHQPELKESSSLFIFVIYEQIWLDGVLEIHPPDEGCSKLPQ